MKEQTCCMDCVETPAGTVHGFGCLTVARADRAAREDAQRCPDGFRCGHCVANDKAKREAAREQAVAGSGLGALTGVVRQSYPVVGLAQARTFTREEVLTVLKAKKAEITAMANPLEVLAHLVSIFERIE